MDAAQPETPVTPSLADDNTSARPRPFHARLHPKCTDESGPTVERVCPLCGVDNHHTPPLAESRSPWRLKQCGQCTLVYLENALPVQELERNANWSDAFLTERRARLEREPVLGRCSRWFKTVRRSMLPRRNRAMWLLEAYSATGPVLEVGCGNGRLLQRFPEQFEPWGIEVDAQGVEVAREVVAPRHGTIIQADALSGLASVAPQFFSGALLHAYLEHETRPQPVLRHVWRVLRPGGAVVIKVPNFASWNRRWRGRNWCGFRFPEHVNYFTPGTLRQLLVQTGFEIMQLSWWDRFPLSDNLWLVARRPPRGR